MPDAPDPTADDVRTLHRLGYPQELARVLGGFSNFALSLSIICILAGGVTSFHLGFGGVGGAAVGLGWPLVGLFSLVVALTMAQVASAFPTAGGLYHWAAILGGRGAGFFTAWLNCIGQFAITAGIDYGLSEFVVAMVGLTRAAVLPVYAAVLLSHAVLNHLGVRVVAKLNHLSAWVHVAGVAVLVGAVALFAPHQPADYLLTRFTAGPRPYWLGFLLGLLQAGWTFTGFDASAHVCEETHDPTRNAPWGIFLSVAVSGVVGWALLLGVTLAIGDLRAAAAADNPFIFVLRTALGTRAGSALVWVAMVAMWFCGLSSVTSNSRMLFAFARDGGLPFSAQVARVSERFRSPHVAVWVATSAALAVAIGAEAFSNYREAVYSGMTALSTIALYASYGVPIAIGLWARQTGRWNQFGPWDLGRWSLALNGAALAWILALTILFVLPPNQLAGYTFAGAIALLIAYWLLWVSLIVLALLLVIALAFHISLGIALPFGR